jgi:hypothetical protein
MEASRGLTEADLANQILLVMVTTLDGQLQRPIGMFPTRTASAETLRSILDDVESLLTASGLVLAYISSDCAPANLKCFFTYENQSRHISHPDYPHLVKNIRNHALKSKQMSRSSVWISLDPIRNNRDLFNWLPALTIAPIDKQHVRFPLSSFDLHVGFLLISNILSN